MISETSLISFSIKLRREIEKKIPSLSKKLNYISKKKSLIDPVTKMDIEMEKLIRDIIRKNFKNHNIIGEELKNENFNSDYTWVIDPIDGTKNLILNLPTWSNLIGLYHKKDCIFSFANFPVLKKTFITLLIMNNLVLVGQKKLIQIKEKDFKVSSMKQSTKSKGSSFLDLVETMKEIPGLFTMYWDEDKNKVYMKILNFH